MPTYNHKRIIDCTFDQMAAIIPTLEKFKLHISAEKALFSGVPNITFSAVFDDDTDQKTQLVGENLLIIGTDTEIISNQDSFYNNTPSKFTCLSVNGLGFGTIKIGADCYIEGISIISYSSIVIGNNCTIYPGVTIFDCMGYSLNSRSSKTKVEALPVHPVTIGNNVVIGFNSTIYPGVTIGDNCVIHPNSIVDKDIPSDTFFRTESISITEKLIETIK